jgi:poly(A) polymerase
VNGTSLRYCEASLRIRYSTAQNGRPIKKALVYTRDEHGIDISNVDRDAIRIVERLKTEGHETYIVGGAVRDLMVSKKPKDFDIVTSATPTRIKRVFRNSRIIGRRFRLVHVYFGQKIVEVSTFRSLKDGPTSNTYGTIEEDVLRRDFSINALFYDPQEQVVIDYVGGVRDIRAKKVRPIIPLGVIFKDDPVRMIRAAKYSASTGFSLPFLLRWKIKREGPLLSSVSHSRLTEELFKIINSAHASSIVASLENLGLWNHLQPHASKLMRSDPIYREKYYQSLRELEKAYQESSEAPSGKLLSYLLRDYLDTIVDWSREPLENFRESLSACRSFVIPMNPPRIELENAVRLLFREHGVAVKKARTFEKGRNKEAVPEGTPEGKLAEGPLAPIDGGPEGPKRKKRRRRRRKASATQEKGTPVENK